VNDSESDFERKGAAIGPVGSDRIERIRDCEYPSTDGNLLRLQTTQITAAIVALVMSADQLGGIGEKWDLLDQIVCSVLGRPTRIGTGEGLEVDAVLGR